MKPRFRCCCLQKFSQVVSLHCDELIAWIVHTYIKHLKPEFLITIQGQVFYYYVITSKVSIHSKLIQKEENIKNIYWHCVRHSLEAENLKMKKG